MILGAVASPLVGQPLTGEGEGPGRVAGQTSSPAAPAPGGWPRTAAGPPNTHGATATRRKSLNNRTPDHQ